MSVIISSPEDRREIDLVQRIQAASWPRINLGFNVDTVFYFGFGCDIEFPLLCLNAKNIVAIDIYDSAFCNNMRAKTVEEQVDAMIGFIRYKLRVIGAFCSKVERTSLEGGSTHDSTADRFTIEFVYQGRRNITVYVGKDFRSWTPCDFGPMGNVVFLNKNSRSIKKHYAAYPFWKKVHDTAVDNNNYACVMQTGKSVTEVCDVHRGGFSVVLPSCLMMYSNITHRNCTCDKDNCEMCNVQPELSTTQIRLYSVAPLKVTITL